MVEEALDRMASLEPRVHAMTLVTADQAIAEGSGQDDERDRGHVADQQDGRGVAGRLYVAKDLIDTAGIGTEGGSRVLKGRVPSIDATVIERLKTARAIMLGKAHTHEFAYGVTTPASRNPLDIDRVPGGSSGGSAAAVAAGYCDLSLGTDTIGSIRIPAALCGVVGLRPTYGRVPTDGVIPLSWSLDAVGPICRTVTDVAAMLTTIAGHCDRDPNSSPRPVDDYFQSLDLGVDGLVLGVPKNYFFDSIDPQVEAAVREAIARLGAAGAVVRDIEIPMVELSMSAGFAISLPESSDAHREWFQRSPALYADDVLPYIELGFLRPGHEYVRAQRVRALMWDAWHRATQGVDVVLAPSVPCIAPLASDELVDLPGGPEGVTPALLRLTAPASVLGLPALSVPCHGPDDPLPIGMQVIGRHFDEATVLRVGCSIEQLVDSPRIALDARISS